MSVRSVPALAAIVGLSLACEVAQGPDLPRPAASDAGPEPCAPPDAVDFRWTLEPVPEDILFAAACVTGELVRLDDGVALPLSCAEPEGTRARVLSLWATPGLPTAALTSGLDVRLRVTRPGDGDGAFVRLETLKGKLLVAAASAGALLPPDGADPWLPFALAPASSACLSEETACGATRRAAIDLRRAGGAPRIVQDAGFAAVGDRGEAQIWVAAAITGDPACLGASGAWYELGLVATR